MTKKEIKFAPREIFEQMLEWGVMPTFDLVIEQENKGIISVKRIIPPYKNTWALPGLRQYKGEKHKETLERIANKELGLKINSKEAVMLGQYDGFFKTEHNRQDISTGYYVKVPENQKIKLNEQHFSDIKYITSKKEIPKNMGAMYKFHLNKYFELINKN
jgi:ADP-ribose pyrophosphatase YjhB (NUDIX family)